MTRTSVVDLAEALIHGDVLLFSQKRHEPAPAWGYLNLLAHSPRPTLQHVVNFNKQHERLSDWGDVVFDLTQQLLTMAPTDARLQRIQSEALIPLELSVWGGDSLLFSPDDLQHLVVSSLGTVD